MRTRGMRILAAMGACFLLLWLGGSVGAQPLPDEAAEQEGVALEATMTLLLNYQGRLLDPATGGPKPDGAYAMTFSIYDVAAGGSALWTETKYVQVKDGLFSTTLGTVNPLSASTFNGQNLWLGVKVGADLEATPRQQLLPMPYAIHASNADLLDGQHASAFGDITAVTAGAGLSGGGTSGDVTLAADTNYLQKRVTGICGPNNMMRGINAEGQVTCEPDDNTTYSAGSGLSLSGTTFSANFGGSGAASTIARSDHKHGATDIMSGTLSTDRFSAYSDLTAEGSLNNDADGDLLTRSQADGRYVNEGQADSVTAAMVVDGAGSGLDADLLDGQHANAFAVALHNHWGQAWTSSIGTGLTLYGGATGLYGSGTSTGVSGVSTGGSGVQGVSTNSDGVYGKSSLGNAVHGESDSAAGVYGYSKDGRGVYGYSQNNYGGWFDSGTDHGDLVLGGAIGRINTDPNNQNSNLVLSSNNDVEVRLDNDSGENGVFRIKNSGGTDVATVDESGNLAVQGTVSGPGGAALPIAYGYVSASGSRASGTSNVTSTWNDTYDRYEITIAGHSYSYSSYVTQVTLSSGRYCSYNSSVRTASVSGKLLVYIYDVSGNLVSSCDFQFVTFKP